MRYLLDTNAFRAILKRVKAVMERYEEMDEDDVFVSVIAVRETVDGILGNIKNRDKAPGRDLPLAYNDLIKFYSDLEGFQIHPYTDSANDLYNSWRDKPTGAGTNDWRIAASAIDGGMVVVTADKALTKIREYRPELRSEDWGLIKVEDDEES